MRLLIPFAVLVSLATFSCGGAKDPKSLADAGMEALQSQDFKAARTEFGAALEAMNNDPQHAQFMRAKMGELEALAALDADNAKEQFLALSGDPRIDAGHFAQVGGWLAGSGKYLVALDVVNAGMQAYPEHVQLQAVINQLKKESERDPALASAMKDMGYF